MSTSAEPDSAYPPPPSLLSRLWALAQAIGWTGALVAMGLLAVGANAILWAVQFEPESNGGYWLRRQTGQSPPLAQIPPGGLKQRELLSAADLRDALSGLPPKELSALNRQWMRAYLRNFQEQDSAVVLLRGDFVIAGARRLHAHEFMPGAAAFLAQSVEAPDVYVELIAPAPKAGWKPEALRGLREKPLLLEEEGASYVVVRVSRQPGMPWLVTVVAAHPARLEGIGVPESSRALLAPARLRPANLPVMDLELADFLALRENAAGKPPPYRASTLPVRFPAPGVQAELPPVRSLDLPKLSALLEAPATPGPESDSPDDLPLGDSSTLDPATLPPPGDAARKLADELQREMITWAQADWPLYATGQMPRGRLLTLTDAVKLRGYPLTGDPYYLAGRFEITAAGARRCVLRLADGAEQARFSARKGEPERPVRFILDFPTGVRPPPAGRHLHRSLAEPLQLHLVENSLDGQLNVYLREVIAPDRE